MSSRYDRLRRPRPSLNPSEPKSIHTVGDLLVSLEADKFFLRSTLDELRPELQQVRADKEGVQKEYQSVVADFVEQMIPDLDAPGFETLHELGMMTVNKESLESLRSRVEADQACALKKARLHLQQDLTVQGFRDLYAQISSDLLDTTKALSTARAREVVARAALNKIEKHDDESAALCRLIDQLANMKTFPHDICKTKDQFEVNGFGGGIGDWWKRRGAGKGTTYDLVRTAMERYGHGENGRDFFSKLLEVENARLKAQGEKDGVDADCARLSEAHKVLDDQHESMKPCAPALEVDVLDVVRAQAVSFFAEPRFVAKLDMELKDKAPRHLMTLFLKTQHLTQQEQNLARTVKVTIFN